jgi:membrane protease subunit HflC
MNRITIAGIAALVVLAFLASATLFTVGQTEQVLVVQFGEVVRPIEQAGLHAKLPLVQNVISFDRRVLSVELPGEEVILSEQRRLIVDTFTVFRITDPLRFYQAIGPIPDNIRGRLNSVVTGSLRRVLGNNKL